MQLFCRRYTEWVKYSNAPDYLPIWKQLFKGPSLELYDHQEDPDENVNIGLDNKHRELVKELSEQLHAGWRHAMPSDRPVLHWQKMEEDNEVQLLK